MTMLPPDSPSLKLVLSLLQQKQHRHNTVDNLTDWLISHTMAGTLKDHLSNNVDLPMATTMFNTVSKLFLEEIQSVCTAASPEQDSVPLTRYLTGGRGLLLLTSLSRSAGAQPGYNGELSALLLSLATFLKPEQELDNETEKMPFLPEIVEPQFGCLSLASGPPKQKSSRTVSRPGKTGRRRASRPGDCPTALSTFPEVSLPSPGQICENLAQWEGSPSSEGEIETTSMNNVRDNLVKYIPVNYFAYFDNANLDSDEVTGEASNAIPRPPPLPGPPPHSSPRDVALVALDLVCRLTRHTGQVVQPQQQATMIQLALVASNQMKVLMSPLPLSQLTCILTNCLTSLRFRPDLLLFPPLQSVLPVLLPVISRPQCLPSVSCWSAATVQCLLLWRELATSSHQSEHSLALPSTLGHTDLQLQPGTELAGQVGLGQLVTSALEGLDHATGWAENDARLDVVSCCGVLQCVVQVLPDLSDQETTWHSVNKVLEIAIRVQLKSKQALIFTYLSNLFSTYCYPADQLVSLISPVTVLSSSPNFQAYLMMIEQAMENLAEADLEHTHWADPCLMEKLEDRDSALASSEVESGTEEISRLKPFAPSKELEFEPYLSVLIEKKGLEVEQTLNHIERLVTRANGETRHRIALQVVLPYLAWGLSYVSLEGEQVAQQEDEQVGHMEAVLEILCRLVTQQPTAMALIRNQKVWRKVKSKASSEGTLSRVAQQVIKTIVLNSHKFIKIRLSEAEAMALQDDENDVINFDQRDRNAQFWLFKQLYHVLVQSSIRVLNGDWPNTFSHLVSAWQVSLHLVRRVPDFLVFALERGIVGLNKQLLDIICEHTEARRVEIAEVLGSLVNFLIFLVTSKSTWVPQSPYLELGDLEESIEKNILPKLGTMVQKEPDLRFKRILLSRVLEGSVCGEGDVWPQVNAEELIEGVTDDGYEADQSDDGSVAAVIESQNTCIAFLPGFKFYTSGLLNLALDTGQDLPEELYSLEYLVYRLVKLKLTDPVSVAILNNNFLCKFLERLFLLAITVEDGSLSGLASLVLDLVTNIAEVHISHNTIKTIYNFLANPNCLRRQFFHSLSEILRVRVSDYNLLGISILSHRRRPRLSSNLSSDSGLDSNCSANSGSLILSNSRKFFVKDATEDLERDYTMVMRLRIEVATSRSDEWVELVTVENRNESLGIHINLEKGLKLTLSNWKGTFAAAETNFQTMFEPGKWIHLVFNVGTVTEGNRSTKTLSAFIDCCRVWDVGLSVDRRTNKVRKEKFLCLTVGSGTNNQQGTRQGSEVKTSDVFFLGNCCFSLQDIVMDFLLDSKFLTQPNFGTSRVNLRRLGDKITDLSSYCLSLVSGDGLPGLALLSSRLVAHFSPSGMWNTRTFSSWNESTAAWTFQRGVFTVGGLESVLLLPSAAIHAGFEDRLVAKCFDSAIKTVTADQEVMTEFLKLGGFALLSNILQMSQYIPGPLVVNTFLNNSSHIAQCTIEEELLLYKDPVVILPELISVLLTTPSVANSSIHRVVLVLKHYMNEENQSSNFNLQFLFSSQVIQCLLDCLICLSKDNKSLPMEDITQLLILIPPSPKFLTLLLHSCLLLCPPHLLYLSCPLPHLPGSPNPLPTTPTHSAYLEQVHAQEVVDVSSILSPDIAGEITKMEIKNDFEESSGNFNLEYLDSEEDIVGEWEVVATSESNNSVPPPPVPKVSCCSNPLISSMISSLLTGFTLLSDSDSCDLIPPSALFSLISHPSTDIHSPALSLLGLCLQRGSPTTFKKFLDENCLELVTGLIQQHHSSQQLVESVLSLLHGHRVNINIPFEFQRLSPPMLNLAMSPLLLPVLHSSMTEVSLCHNLLSHIHELTANLPNFLAILISHGLPQTLLSLLIALGDNPGESSDMCGIFESDLLLDDIHNILRLVVVCYIDQTQEQYETILDLLFMCAGLFQPGVVGLIAGHNIRVTLCLLIEESLFTLQKAISSYTIFKPSHYLDTEDLVDKAFETFKAEETKPGSQLASQNHLLARFNQVCKFGVNFVTSQEITEDFNLLPEEVGLSNSLYSMLIDLECGVSRKKAGDPLVKGLQDGSSLAGVLLVTLLKSSMSRSKRTELVRRLDALPNCVVVLKKLFPLPAQRESFRLCIVSLLNQTVLMDPVDSELVTRFYGKMLTVSLFPDGPGLLEVVTQLKHKTYGPWEAERRRCRTVMMDKRQKLAVTRRDIANRFTVDVVAIHDKLSKESLEKIRRRLCQFHEAGGIWRRIVDNQTHPLGVWHCKDLEPSSLVLENVTGTSGIFTRLKKGHVGLFKPRYFKEGHKHLCESVERHFPQLVEQGMVEDISLSDRLGGLDQVQCVESVHQVTATDKIKGELVISTSKVYFVGQYNWVSNFSTLEAVCKRRYQLQDIALEFFLASGEANLIVFSCTSTRASVVTILTKFNVPSQVKSANLPVTTKLWRQGHLTNFQYLMELNRLAGRTLNDLMQYPVFPWVLADYTSPHLNLTIPDTFRCLKKPIAVQKEGSSGRYIQNYNILAADGSGLGGLMGPYHYASHYSNTGIVLHFLVRLPPFTGEFIKFQDGNFDLPDRSFHKLATSWLMASEVSASDVKELIPQLFYLPELFVNREGFNLGRRQNGEDVSDVEMPVWAQDPRTFVKIHRQALESPIVRQELSHWIDLVFGYKQTGQEAVDAVNVFHPATYPTNQTQDMDELEARARQTMIETYGQTPLQLFHSVHPLPLAELVAQDGSNPPAPIPVVRTVTGMTWGSYVGAPGQPAPTVVWQQNQGVTVTSLIRLETNEVFGVPSRSVLVGKYNTGHCLGQINTGLQFMCGQLLTWGHSDMTIHCHGGKMGEDKQVTGSIFPWDQPVCGATHPRVCTVWLGHQSGVVSVFPLTHSKSGPALEHPTRLHGHTGQVTSLVLCPEFGVAVSGSDDGSVISWDLHSLQLLHHITLPPEHPRHLPLRVAISAKSGDVAVAQGQTITLCTINLYKVGQSSVGDKITALAFSNQEEGVSTNCVAVGLQSGLVKLYSSLDLLHLRDVSGIPNSPITALAYSEDSQNLAIATQDGVVTILEKSGNRGLNRTPKYVTLQ